MVITPNQMVQNKLQKKHLVDVKLQIGVNPA